jgi:hypothetical protein
MSEMLTPYLEINKVLRLSATLYVSVFAAASKKHIRRHSTVARMTSNWRSLKVTVLGLAGDEAGTAVGLP